MQRLRNGFGHGTLQKGKPFALASRALSKQSGLCYIQIEKKFLAMVFSIKKFHHYTCKITVQSRHKPLETMVRKPLLSDPKRLKKMMLRIQRFDLHVVYKPVTYMLLAGI